MMPEPRKPFPAIEKLIISASNQNASDLHLKVGYKPIFRVGGRLIHVDTMALSETGVDSILKGLLSEKQQATFSENGNLDSSFELNTPEGRRVRCRVNVGKDHNGDNHNSPYASIRIIPNEIMKVEDIGFPYDIWKDVVNLRRGLVLVTGVTGSGKTTTLASLVQRINETRQDHILTIEDPIEYVYEPKKSIISQREVGINVRSFGDGVKYALRQDPDIILIGEIRDAETAEKALEAAATGHLVFSTLHTKSAADTVRRYVNMFPPEDHNNIRNSLATTLEYVLTQQLIPYDKGEKKRVMAMEVMNVGESSAIKNHLREEKYHQITSVMQTGRAHKMVTMDARLKELHKNGRISREDAITYAHDLEAMRKSFEE